MVVSAPVHALMSSVNAAACTAQLVLSGTLKYDDFL